MFEHSLKFFCKTFIKNVRMSKIWFLCDHVDVFAPLCCADNLWNWSWTTMQCRCVVKDWCQHMFHQIAYYEEWGILAGYRHLREHEKILTVTFPCQHLFLFLVVSWFLIAIHETKKHVLYLTQDLLALSSLQKIHTIAISAV